MLEGPDHLPPTPTEHWIVDARHQLHVADDATDETIRNQDCVAAGRTHTMLGYGSIVKPIVHADALERVLNVLDKRYPNHRWFIER